MEIVLDTWTTNKRNRSKNDPKIVLREPLNRHHKAKLKMWTQKFDLIENICLIRTTYQRDRISPTPIGSSAEKGVHHLRDISTYRYTIISICHDEYLDISAYQLSRSVSKVSRLVNKLFDLIFQVSEYENQRQKHDISCQYKLFEEENLYIFGSKWLGYLIVANNPENK